MYSNLGRLIIKPLDMAGPSDPHPVQQEQNQINNHPLTEEGKRVIKPTEKVK